MFTEKDDLESRINNQKYKKGFIMSQSNLTDEEECPLCNGEGEIWVNTPSGPDHETCDYCQGTGKI